MKEHKIQVTINEDATMTIDAEGFAGDACVKEVEKLLDDIASLGEIRKKPDYYKNVAQRQHRTTSVGGHQ